MKTEGPRLALKHSLDISTAATREKALLAASKDKSKIFEIVEFLLKIGTHTNCRDADKDSEMPLILDCAKLVRKLGTGTRQLRTSLTPL
jgi:hypothetical protein